ncbi:MAG: 23S rRNA pseudouridine(2604) synthase RluF [Cyclobacteriaceae bacterium]
MEKIGSRINKYLSEIGHCSRREADVLIAQGRVRINGRVPEPGTRVQKKDEVIVDGLRVSDDIEPDVYLAFHKPEGIVSTTDPAEKSNIIKYLMYPRRIFPIGRLDKMSEGLILLTSDGDIVNKILRAHNNHEKEYEVSVNRKINPRFIEQMSGGLPIMGTMTKKCKVEATGPKSFKITLTQGLNRQIRRMCEYLDYEVVTLKRTRIMNISLDMPVGDWRDLTESELSEIMKLVEHSSKTQKKSSSQSPKKKSGSKPKHKSFSEFKRSEAEKKRKNKNHGKRNVRPAKPNRNSSKGRRGSR